MVAPGKSSDLIVFRPLADWLSPDTKGDMKNTNAVKRIVENWAGKENMMSDDNERLVLRKES
jgi:hypothetical protein